MFTFTFKTREEYLIQKKEWFIAYKQAIHAVRERKNQIKAMQREGQHVGLFGDTLLHVAQHNLDKLVTARQESRHEAQRQYLMEKQT